MAPAPLGSLQGVVFHMAVWQGSFQRATRSRSRSPAKRTKDVPPRLEDKLLATRGHNVDNSNAERMGPAMKTSWEGRKLPMFFSSESNWRIGRMDFSTLPNGREPSRKGAQYNKCDILCHFLSWQLTKLSLQHHVWWHFVGCVTSINHHKQRAASFSDECYFFIRGSNMD
jgi:hypothetical protein